MKFKRETYAMWEEALDVSSLNSVMNNSKWDELRLRMYDLENHPAFRRKNTNGYYSNPDKEWYYHFREVEYQSIAYVDIIVSDIEQRDIVRAHLKSIHVPGEETAEGFRVYGYGKPGQSLDYI